jgi:PGF-pre-PGF domain-containing protein
MVKNFEKIFLSFFLFIFLVPAVIAVPSTTTTTTTTTATGPLSEYTGSINVQYPLTGNVVLPGNVTYPDGTACTSAGQCAGGYCVHSYCRSSSTYCGDGYCDSGESCSSCSYDCGVCPSGGTGGAPQVVTETESIGNAAAGSTTHLNVTNLNQLKISEIDITFNNSVSGGSIQVTESSAPGSNFAISSDIGVVYKYLQITKTNINDSDISSVTIKFQIEKSWLTANGIDPTTVKLKRLVGSTWTDLPTVKTGEDATYVYFEATSPGLSLFAITGKKIVTTTSSTSSATSSTSSSTSSTTYTIPPIAGLPSAMWLVVFLVIIVVVVILFGMKQKTIMKEVMPTEFLPLTF